MDFASRRTGGGAKAKESAMCYEFAWFTKARAAELARQQRAKTEPVTKQEERQPDAKPAVAPTAAEEREAAPA